MIKAYKETLFIKRTGSNIFDISEIFIDIFTALFYDTDQQANDNTYKKNLQVIKSYRLWDFTEGTIELVVDIYKTVFKSKNNEFSFAEIVFLEKLFGLMTINNLLSRNFKTKESLQIADCLSQIIPLGYNNFSRKLINDITLANCNTYRSVIEKYIYPLCSECNTVILNDIITYMGRITVEKRGLLIEAFINTCTNAIQFSKEGTFFTSIKLKPDVAVKLFKALHDVPSKNNTDSIREYMVSSNGFFDDKFYKGTNPIEKIFVFDRGYIDFSYLKKQGLTVEINSEYENLSRIPY